MLKKKRKVSLLKNVMAEKKEKTKKVKTENTYIKVLPDVEVNINETTKLVFGVAQTSPDSPAHVDIRTWVNTDKYNGPTKRGINFNQEYLDEVINVLTEMRNDLDEMNIK